MEEPVLITLSNEKPYPCLSLNEHASVRLEDAQGRVVYVDPYGVDQASADANLILITHTHYDHLDPASIVKLSQKHTCFLCPPDAADALLEQGIAKENIATMVAGDVLDIDALTVEAVPAYNIGKTFHPQENGWLGYVITMDDVRVYVAGDTDLTEDACAVECDVACVPVGGTYTTTAEEAAQLVARMHPLPKLAVPTHYGTVVGSAQDGSRFFDALRSLVGKRVFVRLPY